MDGWLLVIIVVVIVIALAVITGVEPFDWHW